MLSAFLESEGDFEIAGEAGDGETALAVLEKLAVDVVTFDISMPGPPIGKLIRAARRLKKGLPIVVVTMLEHDRYRQEAIDAGASGFVLKKNASTELAGVLRKACEKPAGPGGGSKE